MKQRAHAWVAFRALKLLDDTGVVPRLVELLSYYLSDVWEGTWLPDTLIVDMQYGHIFKMSSDPQLLGVDIAAQDWFKVPYKELASRLKGNRRLLEYVLDEPELNKPYRSHPEKSGHLPNRVIAISQNASDMLKMTDYPLAFYAQQKKSGAYKKDLSMQSVKDLSLSPNFSARQIALTFFILSHYITDAHMPLHCDLRDYGSGKSRLLPAELHPSIEEEWEKQFPTHETLILHKYKKDSIDDVVKALPGDSIIAIDKNKEYSLGTVIPVIAHDEWLEFIHVCRLSYAVSRKWADKPYSDVKKLIKEKGQEEFTRITNFIFHDAVTSVAAIWRKVWNRFEN